MLGALLMPMPAALAQHPPPAVLTLHYQERPPFYETGAGGELHGHVVDPLKRGLARAGIAHSWQLTPSQRQLLLIEQGHGLHCGLGWFRNPQRETRGRFSAPLYRGQPIAMLARRGSGLREGMSMREAVQQTQPVLLVKAGYSYGVELDALIAARSRAPEISNGDMPTLMRMLQAGRADWMPVTPEEGRILLNLAEVPLAPGQFTIYRFADAPPAPTRHLYCNKEVPQELLDRLDGALPPLP
jgi:polar amino acid transport system substrate-binding protein